MQSEWLYIGYICAFFAVYIGSVLLSLLPTVLHEPTPAYYSTSYMYTMNATVAGNSTVASFLPMVFLILGGMTVVLLLTSGFAFRRGLDGNEIIS